MSVTTHHLSPHIGLRDHPPSRYVIALPAPNVTGSLHLGHALNLVLQDVVARYARVQGHHVEWRPGVDHAGLSAQIIADRALKATGNSRQAMGPAAYDTYMHHWYEDHRSSLLTQMRRLDLSADWDHPVSSLDAPVQQRLQEIFARMHDTGLLYREQCLVNWCTSCETCIPDEEIARQELTRTSYVLTQPAEQGGRSIATLQPALLLACVALRGGPEDRPALVDVSFLRTPLPVLPAAGTGRDRELSSHLTLVVPSYNADDFDLSQSQDWPLVNLFDGVGNVSLPGTSYDGLTLAECNQAVIEAAQRDGWTVDSGAYLHGQARHRLCDGFVLPRLTRQWFVRLSQLVDTAKGLRTGTPGTAFNAPSWRDRYLAVLDLVAEGGTSKAPWWEGACLAFVKGYSSNTDWLISRQNAWGIPIPAQDCPDCDTTVVQTGPPISACPVCGHETTPTGDVFDVLFHSAFWADCVAPGDSEVGYADLAVIGHDILEFWIPTANLFATRLSGHASVRTVLVHGLLSDPEGRKMSKSLGNVIDLNGLLDAHDTETVRALVLGLAATAGDADLIPVGAQAIDLAARRIQDLRDLGARTASPGGRNGPAQPILLQAQERVDEQLGRMDVGGAYLTALQVMTQLRDAVLSDGDTTAFAGLIGPFHPSLASAIAR